VGVIRNEAYLNTDHQPDQPVGRESEIQKIADAIRPVVQRREPENILAHGPAGIGKTTCVQHVLDELEEQTSVLSIEINCWQYNTRSSLLTELLIQLGYPAPRKGKPVDEILSKIKEWLDKNRGVVVVLDEFDQLDDRTEVAYDLEMLSSDTEHQLGVIMVSNQHPNDIEMAPRSRSRLNCRTLEFEPYKNEELVEILEQRVEQSFHPGTVPDSVLHDIAEAVTQQTSDCRKALEMLLRAGRHAERNGYSEVNLDRFDSVAQLQ